ncbi:MAG TPA: hypothetical protein VM537_18350 [Anaerolineae bacterium]|nr:hypothetical protein [Anaerolineae bacterium]
MNDVLILRQADKAIEALAKRAKLQVVVAEGDLSGVPFDRALIVEPGMTIPWAMVEYGFHFLERWDAAAPLWRYGVLAEDVGTPSEHKRTAAITRDLRVLLYAHELLFVRNSPDGRALLAAWQEGKLDGGEPRLAFLRALYRVKPIFCTLPRSWAGETRAMARGHASARMKQTVFAPRVRHAPKGSSGVLVRVELRPGVYIRCHPGEEEDVLKRFGKMHLSREERRE